MDEKKNTSDQAGPAVWPPPGFVELLAMSSHGSGFKRENAVRRLGMIGNPLALPYLIERANDWVPQVRAAARDALSKLLRAENAEAFVTALPKLLHLQTCLRDDHTALLQAVQDFLLREENVHHLLAGLQNPDVQVARVATRWLVERSRVAPAAIVAAGLSNKDAIVRSIVLELLGRLDEQTLGKWIAMALSDSYMPVRREAFQQLLARDAEAGLRVARDMLFDRSASIREIAVRRLLDAREPVEQLYDSALVSGRGRVAIVTCVLWSWAFMNCKGRSEQVRTLLASRSPSVRRAALQTIVRLIGDDAEMDAEAALADASPAVCKEAARLIVKMKGFARADRLVTIAQANGLAHVAIACCRVARSVNKWEWLKFVLKVYGAPDAAVDKETFSNEIDAWDQQFNRSNAQPDAALLLQIVFALHACENKLTADQLRMLKFTLKGYAAS